MWSPVTSSSNSVPSWQLFLVDLPEMANNEVVSEAIIEMIDHSIDPDVYSHWVCDLPAPSSMKNMTIELCRRDY